MFSLHHPRFITRLRRVQNDIWCMAPSWPGRGKKSYLRNTLRRPADGLCPSASPTSHQPARAGLTRGIPSTSPASARSLFKTGSVGVASWGQQAGTVRASSREYAPVRGAFFGAQRRRLPRGSHRWRLMACRASCSLSLSMIALRLSNRFRPLASPSSTLARCLLR